MRSEALEFDLPRGLIAVEPAEPRESARLMVLSRSDPARVEHRRIADLPDLLGPGDLMVVNDTRVVPARFLGVNLDTGGRVEGLYLRDTRPDEAAGERGWIALLKARRHRAGARVVLLARGERSGVVLELVGPADQSADGAGAWRVAVEPPGNSLSILERVGLPPLPPYVLAARREALMETDRERDRADYQTSYATHAGSVAAPTAGLHLTPALLARLEAAGVDRETVTLHVGAGTFKPIETDDVEAHPMHAEWCSMSSRAVSRVFDPARNGRVVAVGSTSARTIESYAPLIGAHGPPPEQLETRLMIAPGYRWRGVDTLLTNFHLPRSTLLAMVASFLEPPAHTGPTGIERLMAAYREAIKLRYRFFSFGDAMLILP